MHRTDTTTSQDGTTLAYDVRGDGEPLVVINGATCFRRFAPVVKDTKIFAGAFTVYSYDRRGRGDSSDTEPWSIDREVDDVEAIVDAAGGSGWLYGHSSGAVLAMHAALRFPDKIRGVVLADASWVADESEQAEYADLRERIEDLLDDGKDAAALRRFLIGIGMPRVFVAALPLMPGWRSMVRLAPTLRYDMALTADPPPLHLAATLQVPTHILVGERSPAPLHEVARQLAASIPGATSTTLPKQDHMMSPKVVLPVLIDHFELSSP